MYCDGCDARSGLGMAAAKLFPVGGFRMQKGVGVEWELGLFGNHNNHNNHNNNTLSHIHFDIAYPICARDCPLPLERYYHRPLMFFIPGFWM
jgi:hypothetical protein